MMKEMAVPGGRQAKAEAKWVRISPRKVKRVIGAVKGKAAAEALSLLKFMPQKGARILEKVIKSAVANAKNNYKMKEENLYISQIYVTQGLSFVRYKPRARGRMDTIKKRTSHVRVCVSSRSEE